MGPNCEPAHQDSQLSCHTKPKQMLRSKGTFQVYGSCCPHPAALMQRLTVSSSVPA